MATTAKTADEYVETLPPERKQAMADIRKILRKNLPKGFQETVSSGMLAYVVPHSLFPAGYHCTPTEPLPFICVASQKQHISLYHMGLYADKTLLDWFTSEYPNHSKTRLDMGKSCIRFRKIDDIPITLIGELAAKVSPQQWIKTYQEICEKK